MSGKRVVKLSVVGSKESPAKVGNDERRQIFCEVIDRLMQYDLADVARESGVSYSCLYNWLYGDTKSPLLRTVVDVAQVIGLEFVLVDTEGNQVAVAA